MKKYLNTLRPCIWASALLPIIYYACLSISQIILLSQQWIYFPAYIALFIWAGSKAVQANYSVSQSAFSGPALLVVSLLLVTTALQVIVSWPTITENSSLWVGVAKICFSTVGTFLFCFPIALGFSALGAYVKKKTTH